MFCDIIIDISIEKLDRPFTYGVPENLVGILKVGDQVNIPFGKGNNLKKGFVIALRDDNPLDNSIEIKYIDSIIPDCGIYGELIKLAELMARNYGGTLNQALRTCLPLKKPGKAKIRQYVCLNVDHDTLKAEIYAANKKHALARVKVLNAFLEDDVIPKDMLRDKLSVTDDTIKRLVSMGIVTVDEKRVYRNVLPNEDIRNKPVLNDEQLMAVDTVIKDFDNGIRKTYLLKGITGSGKTEVYMEIIEHVIDKGRSVILLIPEIALTYQTLIRYYRRFGDRIAVLHSKLSEGERFDELSRVLNGEADIMIGPRSALFTPFSNLGLIIIDEEHEGAYKSDKVPKYHAVDVANLRAKMNDASVILGSATPSLSSFYKAKADEYKLLSLNRRYFNNPLPHVDIVDMRDELKKGNKSIFSDKLDSLIEDRLSKHEQIMLFLNRRGMAGFINCRSCGFVAKCKNCDVSLTLHKGGLLKCHYCGYEEKAPDVCPSCGSKFIGSFNIGTEKIEELVLKKYPAARVLRMDADTTKTKNAYDEIIDKFMNHEADILIGTQMIVKGHDFKDVTLVGILACDMSLYINDYHAAERTFELLTQSAGRAGRGEIPGEVVFQTYNPDNYAIISASLQDYERFYNEEITYRKALRYPPFGNIMVIMMQSEKEDAIERLSKNIKEVIDASNNRNIAVLGPTDATIKRINNIYRKIIYVKSASYEELVLTKDIIEKYRNKTDYKDGLIYFDFNPSGNY